MRVMKENIYKFLNIRVNPTLLKDIKIGKSNYKE